MEVACQRYHGGATWCSWGNGNEASGNFCPVRSKVYKDSEVKPGVRGDTCQLRVYCQCEGEEEGIVCCLGFTCGSEGALSWVLKILLVLIIWSVSRRCGTAVVDDGIRCL